MGQSGSTLGPLAFSIVGKVAGGFIGGPIGAGIGGMAGGLIGSLIFQKSSKPAINDYQLANSSYGRPIPLIYGQARLAGTIIWETEIDSKAHSAGAGKGMGQSTYTYSQSAAIAFVQGPARLLKVWLDGKLFYDATSAFPRELVKKGKFVARIYTGTEDQAPDPLIAGWDVGNVDPPLACPAYRGLAYIVADQMDLTHYGNRMPNWTAAWATDVTDKIIYQHLKLASFDPGDANLTGGLAGGITEPQYFGSGIAIDWTALRAYWLSADGSLRVWDIRSGATLFAKTWEQLWPAETPIPQYMRSNTHLPVVGIAIVPGGNLYIIGSSGVVGGSWHGPYLMTLNPNTLTITSYFPTPYNWPNNGPSDLVPFALVSAEGSFDMLACQPLYGGSLMIIGCAGAGSFSGFMPGSVAGVFGRSTIIVGKQDTIQGLVEIWSLQWNYLGDPWHVYIWKATVAGNDPSAIAAMGLYQLMGTLTPADFGCSTPSLGYMSPVVAYDPADDTLIISDGFVGFGDTPSQSSRSIKWSPRLGVLWIKAPAVMWSNTKSTYYDLTAGRVGDSNSGSHFAVTDMSTTDTSNFSSSPSAGFNVGYDSFANAIAFRYILDVTAPGVLTIAYLQRATGNEIPVADILLDLCVRAGIAETDVDVSLVTATTIGYTVGEEKAYGACVADLCHTYNIDMVESDYKLKFIPRGQPSIVSITQADLSSIDNDQAHYWQAKRAQEQEMPLQINVRYADPEIDYQTGASYAKRTALPVPTVYSRRVKTVDLPVVATNAEAHQIAESWLYTMWAERDTYQTRFGSKYLWVDPADSVTIELDNGDVITARIENTEVGVDYSMQLHLASEDSETYTPSLQPGALIAQTPQVISQSQDVNMLQFNMPLLVDTDDLGGTAMRIYYAGGPTGPPDSSMTAQVYESTDGISWPLFSTIAGFANWGYAGTILGGTVSAFTTDFTNTLIVTLVAGSTAPASCTYTDLMNGVNPILVGSEIIQAQNITLNTDGTVTLDTLLRGRRGTEWAIGSHQGGEVVVFLEVSEIIPGILSLAQLNATTYWKMVPTGHFIDSTQQNVFAYKGYDMFPYAPVNFKRAVSGSDLVITWKRRTRVGGLLVDGSDTPPLAEATEAYEIYILANAAAIDSFDPATPASYVRKFTPTSATQTYTAAQMVTDGFTPATDTLYVAGYQISAVVGRGFQGYQALPAF